MTREKVHPINVTDQHKKLCLSLHYNGVNSYSFVNGVETYKFKAKDSEIKSYPLCLGKISKDFSTDYLEETGLYEFTYDFSVDYDSIDVDNILNIH